VLILSCIKSINKFKKNITWSCFSWNKFQVQNITRCWAVNFSCRITERHWAANVLSKNSPGFKNVAAFTVEEEDFAFSCTFLLRSSGFGCVSIRIKTIANVDLTLYQRTDDNCQLLIDQWDYSVTQREVNLWQG